VNRALLGFLVACGSNGAPAKSESPKGEPKSEPVLRAPAKQPWPTPAGWKGETIPFPLDFAPTLAHRGVEELRFAPGMFDPAAPGYWSYAFVWRTDNVAQLDAKQLGDELTVYFRGLIAAVDKSLVARSGEIAATATGGPRFELKARVIDAFKSKQPVDLVGWAERKACGSGALWIFVFAPPTSTLRGELDALAKSARC
jgi:hypothetical protein